MTDPPPANISALRRLAELSHRTAYARSAYSTPGPYDETAYEAALAAATTDLRRHLMDVELSTTSLQSEATDVTTAATVTPADDEARRRTLLAEIAANRAAFSDPGYIPAPESPLNLLLAYRSITRTIAGSLESIPRVEARLSDYQQQLDATKKLLAEQTALTTALESRLNAPEPSEEDGGAAALRDRSKLFSKRTARALKELNRFIDSILASQLEVEEVGGPVAGMAEELKGRGKARGQRRIDDMFRDNEGGGSGVAKEMKTLLEALMNEGQESGGYVSMPRESAASRFLVRVGVARLHPKDATKIRMIDFGARFEEDEED